MSFNIYNYTVLNLETFEAMTYDQSLNHTGRVVFLNEFKGYYTLLLEDRSEPVLYFPLSVNGKRLNCYWRQYGI